MLYKPRHSCPLLSYLILLCMLLLCTVGCKGGETHAEDAASESDTVLGMRLCTTAEAEELRAIRTPSDADIALSVRHPDGSTGKVPFAYRDKTPTYYLHVDPSLPGWDDLSVGISDSTVYIVLDDPMPEKAEVLREGTPLSLLICGKKYYGEATMICTGLPLMVIDPINDAGKPDPSTEISDRLRTAQFSFFDICDPETGTMKAEDCYTTFRIRGNSSVQYDKKAMRLEFFKDPTLTVQKNLSMCGLRRDDDWILNAIFQDESKIRDMLLYDVWEDIGADAFHDGTYCGSRMRYIELIFAGQYWGLYGINEPLDAKQFGLNETAPGVVYKVRDWLHPTTEELRRAIRKDETMVSRVEVKDTPGYRFSEEFWNPYYRYAALYESDIETIQAEAEDLIDVDNMVNMWIFINALSSSDNRWKNTYVIYRAKEDKVITVPWDCDLSMGISWTPDTFMHHYHEPNTFTDIYDMHTFTVMRKHNIAGFRQKLYDRWQALRADWLTEDYLIGRAHEFRDLLIDTGALDRNLDRWPDTAHVSDLSYIEEFIRFRIPYLDAYMEELIAPAHTAE